MVQRTMGTSPPTWKEPAVLSKLLDAKMFQNQKKVVWVRENGPHGMGYGTHHSENEGMQA